MNPKNFSFLYNGKSIWEYPMQTAEQQKGDTRTVTYLLEDGLKITQIAKKYPDYGASEWVQYFENTGSGNSGMISELWDCDCTLPWPHEEPRGKTPHIARKNTHMHIYAPLGSLCNEMDFSVKIDNMEAHEPYPSFLFPGKAKEFCNKDGRSSDGQAPFFNIHQQGKGVIMAIGWSGQWNCRISREPDTLRLQSKIEDTHFYLLPGEKLRTSSVVLMSYEGDFLASQNQWRRFLRAHFTPQSLKESPAPFCAAVWGGMPGQKTLERVELLQKYDIPVEYLWMDAGWYGADTQPTPNEFEGDWAKHTGDWVISPLIHPDGMQNLVQKLKEMDKKFLLWFEPERVKRTTPIYREHPEYFIDDPDNKNLLLNLGDPAAFNYCLATLTAFIEKLNISCYRQDFNFRPLPLWRYADSEDRRGITEIKHIMGLYHLWDTLLERFPHLVIDNCASGGRRIDIELLRRSIPLWRSDAQCPADYLPEISQAHTAHFSLWMPYSGTGSGRVCDIYNVRSSYSPALNMGYLYSQKEQFGEDPEKMRWFKQVAEEYLRVRPYFEGDLYPLTAPQTDTTTWYAEQWHRPERGDGLIRIFKRENAPYTEAVYTLHGLDPAKTYRVTDLDGGSFTFTGNELRITLPEKRTAKLLIYQEM